MATFFQGAQLAQVVRFSGTDSDMDGLEIKTIYTIPSGYYGVLKWVYVGRNDSSYHSGVTNCSVHIAHSSCPQIPNEILGQIQAQLTLQKLIDQKSKFKANIPGTTANDAEGLYNFYLDEGDRLVIYSYLNNQNIRWEGVVHLYKNP